MPISLPEIFSQQTRCWFSQEIGTPTAVQNEAWPVIATGQHTLVSAPTGTGKTLAAFLVFIDRLKAEARSGSLKNELQLIYVSPLKSLAGDIRENLRRPLQGIAREEHAAGIKFNETSLSLSIAIRTGDTPQRERRQMIKSPPHILITTPESLYLLLTSITGQSILKTARFIILDELHALIDSKRGAHLMLSLARLDRLCPRPLQRIGLSATILPLERAARFLSPDPVTIVAPEMQKSIDLAIVSPYSDQGRPKKDHVWLEIASSIYDRCQNTRSVIAFVEGRAFAEKLAYYVNQLGGEGFARTHHGSLAKEQRHAVEQDLRRGSLRLLCATSSMELGIDVGEIDQVFQIGCPRTISSALQRLGRAGHNPGRTSVMRIFPRTPTEALCSGLTAAVARTGGVEWCHPPRLCLDVLAQHLVSMAAGDGYCLDDVMALLARADPFCDVTRNDVHEVLIMLAGDYEHQRDIPARPRILYDRIHERVTGDPYSRMLAVSTGGTIPDRGLYTVRDGQGVILGQLDEEFVFEARVGNKFLLGSFAWKIEKIDKDTVIVAPASASGAQAPFWKGEMRGRSLQIGLAFGKLLRQLGEAHADGHLLERLADLAMDGDTALEVENLLSRQYTSTGVIADDRTILLEHFRDDSGKEQLMVHSIFGRQVNEPLAILAAEQAKKLTGSYVNYVADDDGFLLLPYDKQPLPDGLLMRIPFESATAVLESMLPVTPLFNMAFRYNAARALMMGVRKAGRQPLWVQRLRASEMLDSLAGQWQHPLIRETKRECLEDYWDLRGVEQILSGIRANMIKTREVHVELPSPFSLPLRQQTEAVLMYDYAPATPGMRASAEAASDQAEMLDPALEQLARTAERTRLPRDAEQLHSLLMIEGDLQSGELNVPAAWLNELSRQSRVFAARPGLWIAAEQKHEYSAALTDESITEQMHLVRRLLRYRGAQQTDWISSRYGWSELTAAEVLMALCQQGSAVERDGLFYHAELYDRARRETIKNRRQQIKTVPPERYAALLASKFNLAGLPADKLAIALRALRGTSCAPVWWESILLPARVAGYRPDMLDTLLSEGSVFWRLNPDHTLSFHQYEEIDWDADLNLPGASLAGAENIIYEVLVKRGPSFASRLTDCLDDEPPYDVLLRLAEKGLVCADSFVPLRQWLSREKLMTAPAKQRVRARVTGMTNGRWEIARPLAALTVEQKLKRAFERAVILCRETIEDLPWEQALETLRIWEYTGQARRGYFISGMAGMQFIRTQDFDASILALEQPSDQMIWLPAVDPAQPWGKSLAHTPKREFINVPGTLVALRAGLPIAVLERQGQILRVFDSSSLPDALQALVYSYAEKRLYPHLNRICIRQYPAEAAAAMTDAGFIREVQNYVLFRAFRG